MSTQEHLKTTAALKLDRRSLMTAALAGGLVASSATSADAAQAKTSKAAGPDPFRGSDDLAVAKTEAGRVRGYIHNSILTFKGHTLWRGYRGSCALLARTKAKALGWFAQCHAIWPRQPPT